MRLRSISFVGALASLLTMTAIPRLDGQQPVHEVAVTARRFMFEPVRLVLRSADTVHGFTVRNLKIDVQIPKGEPVVVEFTAPPAGRYEIACSEFCGSGH